MYGFIVNTLFWITRIFSLNIRKDSYINVLKEPMKKKNLVGILIGETPSSEKTKSIARYYSDCPYCAVYADAGTTVIGVFVLPESHRWWLEMVEKDPKGTVGLLHADVFFTQKVNASSPYSRGEVTPDKEQSPCGTRCERCPWYRVTCEGCPATRYFTHRQ
jgi:hypothetical protein